MVQRDQSDHQGWWHRLPILTGWACPGVVRIGHSGQGQAVRLRRGQGRQGASAAPVGERTEQGCPPAPPGPPGRAWGCWRPRATAASRLLLQGASRASRARLRLREVPGHRLQGRGLLQRRQGQVVAVLRLGGWCGGPGLARGGRGALAGCSDELDQTGPLLDRYWTKANR